MITVVCSFCSCSFTKHKSQVKKSTSGNSFCSRSCSASYNNVGIVRNKPKTRTCKVCKLDFARATNRTKVCNSCLEGYTNFRELKAAKLRFSSLSDIQEISICKNQHPSWKNAHVRTLNRSWNKHLTEKPCANCGYDKHVELCHIKPLSDFSLDETLQVVNAPANIIQLCPNCHWEFDHGLLVL